MTETEGGAETAGEGCVETVLERGGPLLGGEFEKEYDDDEEGS